MSDKVQRKPTPRAKKPRAGARPSGRAVGSVSSRARGAAFPNTRRVSRESFFARLTAGLFKRAKRTTGSLQTPTKDGSSVPAFLSSTPSARTKTSAGARTQGRNSSSMSNSFNLLMWFRALSIQNVIRLVATTGIVAFFVCIGYVILLHLPVCTITSVVAHDSDHVTAQDIAQLAQIEDNTTLFNLDEKKISDRIKKNPWVSQVHFTRKFPNSLDISVDEKVIAVSYTHLTLPTTPYV